MLSQYHKRNVLYIGYIGIHNGEQIFKFGKSKNIKRRDIDEHKKDYHMFELVHLRICDNKDQVEDLFRFELQCKKVHRILKVKENNSSLDNELFAINDVFSLQTAKELMDSLIDTHKLPAQIEYENQIKSLKDELDHSKDSYNLLKEHMKTKDEMINILKSNHNLNISVDYENRITELEELIDEKEKTIKNMENKFEEQINSNIEKIKELKQKEKIINELKSKVITNQNDECKNPDNIRINLKKKKNSYFIKGV